MKQHQISHRTWYDRYPNIFKTCSDYFTKDDLSILSFGCSDGSEVFTLNEIYFPDAEIHGVDINSDIIEVCNSKNTSPKIKFGLTKDLLNQEEIYDLIFCMSVFCRWPQTESIDNSSEEYTFNEFENEIASIYKHLKPGGALVIYNANFCFFEIDIYSKFTPLTNDAINESGFVHKFNSKNKKVDINYKDCIFIKK